MADKVEFKGRKKSTKKEEQQNGGSQGSRKGSSKSKQENLLISSYQARNSQSGNTQERDKQDSIPDDIVCRECKCTFSEEDDKLIECDRCEEWFCLSCTGMNETYYDMLNDKTVSCDILWLCTECKAPAIRAVKTDMEIETRCEEFLSRFQLKVEEELRTVKNDVEALKEVTADQSTNIQSMRKEILEEAIREVQERQDRSQNLVFFNVEESDLDDPNDSKKEDNLKVNNILKKIGVGNITVSNPTRLGKKDGSVRPLRVHTASNGEMTKILGAAKKLKETAGLDKVFVNKDRTPLEREEWKRLMEIRKEKNQQAREAGEQENWIIRNNRVVQGRPRDT